MSNEMAIWKCICDTNLEMMFSNIGIPSPKMQYKF